MSSKPSAFACAACLAVALLYFVGHWTNSLHGIVDVFPTGLLSIVFLIALATVLKTGVKASNRISILWFGLFIALSMFLIGQVTSSLHVIRDFEVPPVSEADIFYLVGYLTILGLLLYHVWPYRETISKKVMFVTGLTGVLLLGSMWWQVRIIIPAGHLAFLQFSVYPLLDILLLIVALPILELVSKGTFWRPFFYLVLGLVLTLTGDLAFTWSFFHHAQTYFAGEPWELLYYWGYISVALGFYLRIEQSRRASL